MPSSGNAPRVAVLVHNDATNDSRVLKESASLREQGARVRIVAVERRLKGRAAGTSELAPGLDLHRVPEFALERIAPALTRLTRRPAATGTADSPTTSARSATATTTASSAAPAPPQAGRPSPLALARRLGTRAAGDLGRRAYRTIELGTWWWRSARAAHAFAPEIVHANDTNALVPALAIQALGRREGRRVHLVYDSHELWRHRNVEGRRLLAPLLDAAIEHVAIPRADVVITVSPSIAEWLRRTYHLDRLPLVVRNVPVAGPLPDRGTGVLRERAGLSASDRVIAYGGRITTARGIEETLAALPHLPADVHLVLLGYGEEDYLDQVRARAAELGVAGRVHLVGAVAPAEVSSALADGDVAVVHVRPVCLSYRYALPNKLFESIRAGLPIAAADLPDMRAVVEELGVGEVFSGEEPADLAAALLRILEDPAAYRERARAVAPHLTWEAEAAPLLEAYARLPEEAR
ncbi:glycosyltransferase [Brachybacterium squillarum]|uniref:glycosyltransferase n=1 Tax=Brachybacterium squillarum TaxID=661979 RepID=UPI0022231C5D|nr:glycosyltransferase [Brachybacterium squillarum]MCW1804842.1 glycosyltransferase [Brachybacterium squillarum]